MPIDANELVPSIFALLTGPWPAGIAPPAAQSAGATPTNYQYPAGPYDIRSYGGQVNDSTDDTASLNTTISVAAQTINGAAGAGVSIPTGISILSSEVTLPNRVRISGQNKLGSIFQAKGTWNSGTSPWMFHAANGTSSMFDSLLTDLTVDCNNIAGLGGILSDAWQENCGPRRVLILNFATIGLQYQNGYGGASFSKIEDVEIFSGTTANVVGVQVNQMSVSGASFLLDMRDVSIAGGAQILKGVNMMAESLHARVVHFETCTHGIYLAGSGNHTLIGVSGASTVTNLVTIDPNFNGTVTMLGCYRNGATFLVNDLRIKQIAQLGTITPGSLYTAGTYNNVPLTGGTGTTATAQIVVAGGAVTAVVLSAPGTNYVVGDTLSAAAANIGGTGAGFSIPVFQVFTGIGQLGGVDHSQVLIMPGTSTGGLSVARSAMSVYAWGLFDGTLTGTNAPQEGQNVLSVQRTGVGRYLVTLATGLSSAARLIPQASCATVNLIVSAGTAGAASFTISINTVAGIATDSNQVQFQVAGR